MVEIAALRKKYHLRMRVDKITQHMAVDVDIRTAVLSPILSDTSANVEVCSKSSCEYCWALGLFL